MSQSGPTDDDAPVRRILLAIDSPAALDVLELAAELAAAFSAELAAQLVEDEDLLEVVDFPHVQQLILPTGRSGEVDSVSVRRQIRTLARQARDALKEASARYGVPWSFAVVKRSRRRPSEQSSQAGDWRVSITRRLLPGGRRHGVASWGPPVRAQRKLRHPAVIVLTHAGNVERLLRAGSRLAATGRHDIVVLLAARAEESRELEAAVQEWLARHPGENMLLQRVPSPNAERLGRALRVLKPEIILLMPDGIPEGLAEAEEVYGAEVPVLLVR